jgi:hypothetical protein
MDKGIRFKRHFQVVKREDFSRFSRLMTNPTLIHFKEIAEDYLRILRLRFPQNNIDIAIAERTIRDYKKLAKEFKNGNDNTQLDYYNTMIDLNKLVRNKYKEIGDALAWKLFDYDRSRIFVFSNRPDSGFLQAEGIKAELFSWLREYYAEGKMSILNSVTNCLKIGDVTSKDDKSLIEVFEIKSGKKSAGGRRKRQLKVMDNMVELLNNKILVEGDIKKKLIEYSFYPQNYFDKFNALLSQAYKKGYGLIQLNEFSFLDIVNFELADDFEKVISELEVKRNVIIKEWDNRTFNFNNSGRFDFSPIGAPYSIFPLKENICTDLMFGKLSLNYNINFTKFEEYIENKAVDVVERPEEIIKKNPNLAVQYLYLFRSGKFYLNVTPMMFHKLVFEFCHPNVMVKEFFYLKENFKPNEADQVLSYNIQENKLWK